MVSNAKYVKSMLKFKHLCIIVGVLLIIFNFRFVKEPNNYELERTFKNAETISNDNNVNYNIHIFYYAWYRNREYDGHFNRWYLEKENEGSVVASRYFPSLGLYSSNDPKVVQQHMKMIKDAGVGVLVLGWVPPSRKDSPNIPLIVTQANVYNLKVALHVLDYANRSIEDLRVHLRGFFKKYKFHRALYKVRSPRGDLPMVYIQNSHKIHHTAWQKYLYRNEPRSIRGTYMDAFYIGTLTTRDDHDHILDSGFDGFYTFFARNGFTYGSTFSSFRYFQEYANVHSLIFVPTVAPGYDDTVVRPWNADGVARRRDGKYYSNAWFQVLISRAKYVSINSFNDWNEGTQVEPAEGREDSLGEFVFEDYGGKGERAYLELTKAWVRQMTERWRQREML